MNSNSTRVLSTGIILYSPFSSSQSTAQHTAGQNGLLKSIHKTQVLEKEMEEVDLEEEFQKLIFQLESEEAELRKKMSANAARDQEVLRENMETMKVTMETCMVHDKEIESLRKKEEARRDLFASAKKNKACRQALGELDQEVKDNVQALQVQQTKDASWSTGMVWGRKDDAPLSSQVKDDIMRYLEDVQHKRFVQDFDAISVLEEDQKVRDV